MSFFTSSTSKKTATWSYTQFPPVGNPNTGTLKFTYDPNQVPDGVIGGSGTMVGADTDPFFWVYNEGVLTWQLTNQGAQPDTKTTFWGNYDGRNSINGNFCNYAIGFELGGLTATYAGP